MTNIGLVGFNQELVDALSVSNANLVTPSQNGFAIEDLDKGLIDLQKGYPVVDTRPLSASEFKLLKAEFEHYSARRKLLLNSEEKHVLFLHVLAKAQVFVNSVDGLVFSNLPHQGVDAVIDGLAQIQGKPCQYFTPSIFDANGYLSPKREGFYSNLIVAERPAVIEIDSTSKQKVSYMAPPLRRTISSIMASKLATFREFGRISKDYPLRLLFAGWADRYFNISYRKINWSNEPDLTRGDVLKVYLPLHFQPELTTSFMGLNYFDQCHAIVQLATLLRNNGPPFKIFVKENPKQELHMRQFLANLGQYAEIVFVGRSVPSDKLIGSCDLTATITGTAGWEAVKSGKPVVIFGTTWYQDAPGVMRFDNLSIKQISVPSKEADPKVALAWFAKHCTYLLPFQFDKGVTAYPEVFNSSVSTIEFAISKVIENVR